jgi:prevent-host-death family protein
MKMGLAEANQQFARLVRAVRRGESVVLTDRGKPLAVVEPLAKRRPRAGREQLDPRQDAALDAMAAEGVLQRATRPGLMRWRDWKPLPRRGKSAAQTVMEMREEEGR